MKEELIKKLKAEMEKFKEKIRESGVDYAIDRAYEITVKQEIIDIFEYDKDLSNEEYKVLKSRENLLEDCYDGWLKCDGNLRSELEFSVDYTIDKVSDYFAKEKEQKSKKHKETER